MSQPIMHENEKSKVANGDKSVVGGFGKLANAVTGNSWGLSPANMM